MFLVFFPTKCFGLWRAVNARHHSSGLRLQAADASGCGLNCGSDAPCLSSSSLENILSDNGPFANAPV